MESQRAVREQEDGRVDQMGYGRSGRSVSDAVISCYCSLGTCCVDDASMRHDGRCVDHLRPPIEYKYVLST